MVSKKDEQQANEEAWWEDALNWAKEATSELSKTLSQAAEWAESKITQYIWDTTQQEAWLEEKLKDAFALAEANIIEPMQETAAEVTEFITAPIIKSEGDISEILEAVTKQLGATSKASQSDLDRLTTTTTTTTTTILDKGKQETGMLQNILNQFFSSFAIDFNTLFDRLALWGNTVLKDLLEFTIAKLWDKLAEAL